MGRWASASCSEKWEWYPLSPWKAGIPRARGGSWLSVPVLTLLREREKKTQPR